MMDEDAFISMTKEHMVILMAQGRGMPSGWVIDVWNLHGVLKPAQFAGHGNQSDEILKFLQRETGVEYEWLDCGYFTVPFMAGVRKIMEEWNRTEKIRERMERILFWILDKQNGGMINLSGFYPVSFMELGAIEISISRGLSIRQEAWELLKYLEV